MKTILLTGATDGIGFETAKLLASKGHHLLIHGRSASKLLNVEKQLKTHFPETVITSYRADLSKFSDIRSMLESIIKAHNSIDVIINNAGILKVPESITQDGLDTRFVVNTFAPYIITTTLLPLLTNNGRLIHLSSVAQAPISLQAMKGEQIINDAFQAYAQSKLALTLWSQEVAKTLKNEQATIAVNPGSLLASKMVKEGSGLAGNDLSIGADILVRAALSEEFSEASGRYFDNDSKQFSPPNSDAQDENNPTGIVEAMQQTIEKFYGKLDIA